MIYLIDDTPVQMLENYLSPSNYSDVLTRIEEYPIEEVDQLTNASCILIHSSYHDTMLVRKIQQVADYGKNTPLVLFSDGNSSSAEFNGANFIISIKKSVLYARLSKFLNAFRASKQIDLNLLSEEKTNSPVFNKKSKEPRNVFEDFFSRVSIELASENEEKNSGPIIYCIGRKGMEDLAGKVKGSFIYNNLSCLKHNDIILQDQKIHDFIVSTFKDEAKMLILDTDADAEVCMNIALHFRLTETLPGNSKYAPIVFISDFTLDRLLKKNHIGSQIFLTDGVFLCHRSELAQKIDSFSSLDSDTYNNSFLDRINIPAPKGSNHSLANQWGASRMYMIITSDKTQSDVFKEFQDIHKRLYFKYIFHKIPSSKDNSFNKEDKYQVKGCARKHILLIDDEASKGWTKALSLLFQTANFDPSKDVISESVLDYDSLSNEARYKIEKVPYDLILLDLRLGGLREDYIVNPEDMSGYKVLRKIKELNRGTQVIMLTASNKAWNLKAVMRPGLGADGYFVKESPEYGFSDQFSIANLKSLIADSEHCLKRGYLRDFWSFIRSIDNYNNPTVTEVRILLDIAFDLVSQADTKEKYKFAFLSLYQVLECITSSLTDWMPDSNGKDEVKLLTLYGNELCREIVNPNNDDIIFNQKPFAIQKTGKRETFSQKDKIAGLFLQSWKCQDHGFIYLVSQLIQIRNAIIHPNGSIIAEKTAPTVIENNRFFNTDKYIYSEVELKTLFQEAAASNVLYSDLSGRPIIQKDIANSSLGIRFLLYIYKKIIPYIV